MTIKEETNNEKTNLFKVEAVYTGIFTISNAKVSLEKILNVECPKFLFPCIKPLLLQPQEAGFPPLSVAPLILMLYMNQK